MCRFSHTDMKMERLSFEDGMDIGRRQSSPLVEG